MHIDPIALKRSLTVNLTGTSDIEDNKWIVTVTAGNWTVQLWRFKSNHEAIQHINDLMDEIR